MYLLEAKPADSSGGENNNNTRREFAVFGLTGSVYNVVISHVPSCTCEDFRRAHASPCKHIMFVLIKVLKVPQNSYLVYQQAFLSRELRQIFAADAVRLLERAGSGDVAAAAALPFAEASVLQGYQLETGRQLPLAEAVAEAAAAGSAAPAADDDGEEASKEEKNTAAVQRVRADVQAAWRFAAALLLLLLFLMLCFDCRLILISA